MRITKVLRSVAIVILAVALVASFSFAQENTEQTKEKAKVEQKEKVKNQEQTQVKNQVQNKGDEQPQTQQQERTREQEQVRAEVQKTIENQASENSRSQTQVRNEIQNRVERQENEQGQVENQHQLQIQHQVQNQTVQNQVTITKEGEGKPVVEHTLVNSKQAQNQTKNQIRNEERARVQNQVKEQPKNRVKKGGPFVDEDGDGINDFYRDHDGDGIPNCQDPDWTAPKDGTGYKGSPEGSASGQMINKAMNRNMVMSRSTFRTQTSLAARICDGTGPKGAVARKGNR